MTIDEESRHQLYIRLEELLGREEATTLMEYLPPVGWADVATKHDLDHLAAVTKRDLDVLEARLETRIATQIQQALTVQTRTIIISNVSTLAAVAALAAVLAR